MFFLPFSRLSHSKRWYIYRPQNSFQFSPSNLKTFLPFIFPFHALGFSRRAFMSSNECIFDYLWCLGTLKELVMVMASLYFLQAFDGQRPMQVLCILKLIPPSVQDLSFDRGWFEYFLLISFQVPTLVPRLKPKNIRAQNSNITDDSYYLRILCSNSYLYWWKAGRRHNLDSIIHSQLLIFIFVSHRLWIFQIPSQRSLSTSMLKGHQLTFCD